MFMLTYLYKSGKLLHQFFLNYELFPCKEGLRL